MSPRRQKVLSPTTRANHLIRELIPLDFARSKLFASAKKYAQDSKEGRLGRSPISKPFWFNRVESRVAQNERRAFAVFHSPAFNAHLQRMPENARRRVINRYRELRKIRGQLQKIAREARTKHPQTPDSMNRSGFDERVEGILRNPNRKPLSFAVIDLDFFGAVNKVFGNELGNRVLEKFTESFKEALRDVGFHGRVGGDEFQVFAAISPLEMKRFLDQFREDFVRSLNTPSFLREVNKLKDPKAKLSAWKAPSFTAGVAGTARHTRKMRDAGLLFRKMDNAMQKGKREGRERTLIISTILSA